MPIKGGGNPSDFGAAGASPSPGVWQTYAKHPTDADHSTQVGASIENLSPKHTQLTWLDCAKACSVADGELLSNEYRSGLTRVARSLTVKISVPSLADSASFNEWLAGLTQSPTTRGNYRRMALRLWSHSLGSQQAYPSRGLNRVKQRLAPPVAWGPDELSHLISVASMKRGTLCDRVRRHGPECQQGLFWSAWILVGYETGLRFGDLHALNKSQLRGNRLFVVVNKTGVPLGKVLSGAALGYVTELLNLSPDGTIFKWALSRRNIFLKFSALCLEAGLGGSSKFLRRSGATAVEIAQPGSASGFLGHLSGSGLAKKHYLDPTLLAEKAAVPPPIRLAPPPTLRLRRDDAG